MKMKDLDLVYNLIFTDDIYFPLFPYGLQCNLAFPSDDFVHVGHFFPIRLEDHR